MKILFHLNSMGRGGAEHVVSILSKKFAEAGHDVSVATLWYSDNEYPLGDAVKRINVGLTKEDEKKGRLTKAYLRLFRLRKYVKKERPDLVISFCASANFRSAISLFGIKTPLIVSVRNNPEVDYAGHPFATRIMEKKAVGCVFQTPDARKWFSKSFQDKSSVIFNPIAEEYLGLWDDASPKDVTRSKRIVNVGRISAQKNQFMLIRAFHKLSEKYPEHVLEIYGDFQEEGLLNELRGYIEKNNLSDKVFFKKTSGSLEKDIKDAALFVLSSDFEGMPNALIEAMALGLPCISTDCPCGGSRMLIENGVSGLLTPVGDEEALVSAMDRLLSDKELADSLGQKATSVIERTEPDMICDQWMEFIRSKI
jgi:glycosyltransferase involved in cell wall biosynthesis